MAITAAGMATAGMLRTAHGQGIAQSPPTQLLRVEAIPQQTIHKYPHSWTYYEIEGMWTTTPGKILIIGAPVAALGLAINYLRKGLQKDQQAQPH